jgi:hypothetical protein
MSSFFRLGVAMAALAGIPSTTRAQRIVNAEVGLNSDFVWRGVTSTNRLVIQPDVSLSVPVHGSAITVGVWGNIEPRRYDGERDISSLNGLPGPLVTQSELYANLSRTIGRVEALLGTEIYVYPHVGNLDDFNTVELIATVTVDAFVSPAVNVSYDVGRIRGAYLETGLTRAMNTEQRGELTLGVLAGFSAGQAEDPRGRDMAYFERDGLTHVDASASATLTRGRVAISPELHVIYAHDRLATVTEPDVTRRAKLWFGTTLSWASDRGR